MFRNFEFMKYRLTLYPFLPRVWNELVSGAARTTRIFNENIIYYYDNYNYIRPLVNSTQFNIIPFPYRPPFSSSTRYY